MASYMAAMEGEVLCGMVRLTFKVSGNRLQKWVAAYW